ncbi:MAG: TRAP transporter small permease [Rhodospirillales bacterium]
MAGALDRLADRATALLFLVASVAMFAMVITRYFFAWSDPSVEIVGRYLMIWGAFLGVGCAARRDVNIRFTLLETALAPRGRRILRVLGCALAAAFAAGLALSGLSLVEETRMFDEVMPTALRWPIWVFHAALPAGGALLALQQIRLMVRAWRGEESAADGPAAI